MVEVEVEDAPQGPLSGVRVVECGSLIAGPFCGQLLGDFGAEVIKVEDPAGGDPMRGWGQVNVRGHSLHWPIIGRNKKSVTANLRVKEGQDLLRGLVAKSDILIENFRPGTFERWGLDYQSLSSINPGLVFVRVSGYGQDGPYASRAGFGAIGEAMGGIRAINGEADRPPARAGISIGDSLAATFAMIGTLLALRVRDRTGKGQVVDAAIYEAVLTMMESILPEWDLAGFTRQRSGAILPGVAPSNAYPTADQQEVLIAANRDTVFYRMADALGHPEWSTDPRYATHEERGLRQAELDEMIAQETGRMKAADLLEVLHDQGVPAGQIYTARDMFTDPQFEARKAILRLVHPELGDFPMQAPVPRLSGTPGRVGSLAPALGEHTEEIYCSILGMEARELDALRASGVI